MFREYRHKDYFFPRSMREAYGYDPTEPPELQCMTRHVQYKRPMLPMLFIAITLAVVAWQVIAHYGH
jgi:hypothetical protein